MVTTYNGRSSTDFSIHVNFSRRCFLKNVDFEIMGGKREKIKLKLRIS